MLKKEQRRKRVEFFSILDESVHVSLCTHALQKRQEADLIRLSEGTSLDGKLKSNQLYSP